MWAAGTASIIGRTMRTTPDLQVWRQHAACRGVSPQLFHPDADDDAEMAKAICARCPVRVTCLEHALTADEAFGVWGGTTERERRRILRRRRRSA